MDFRTTILIIRYLKSIPIKRKLDLKVAAKFHKNKASNNKSFKYLSGTRVRQLLCNADEQVCISIRYGKSTASVMHTINRLSLALSQSWMVCQLIKPGLQGQRQRQRRYSSTLSMQIRVVAEIIEWGEPCPILLETMATLPDNLLLSRRFHMSYLTLLVLFRQPHTSCAMKTCFSYVQCIFKDSN